MKPLPAGAAEAIATVVGAKGVVNEGDWAAVNTEWRGRWRGAPSMVVAPGSVEEIAALVRLCAERRIAVTPQGGNTGLVGGQIATNGEVLILMRRLRRVRAVLPLDNTIVVDAGVTLAEAQAAAAEAGRLFPLSIGSEGSCQIGGVISTNAGGVNVIRYGNCRDLVLGIEAVLPSGDVWNGLKRLRKDNTGYDLKQLFIGGEGTLGLLTGAALKLFPAPREKLTAFAGVPSPDAALRLLARAQEESGGAVTSFELMSRAILALVLKNIAGARDPLVSAHPWYALAEFSAGRAGALRPMAEDWLAAALAAGEIDDAAIAANEAQAKDFWRLRHSMSEAMKPEGGQAKYDVSVPVASVPAFLADADARVERACPGARIVAFGHMGDGNIHYDVLQPPGMSREDFAAREGAIEEAVYDAIDRFDGSISAEHGVGLARRADIARRKSPAEIAMMRAVKKALDPLGIMNPGKML
ncbi:MAG: FAD-binding oxidoreductase [Parvularculaceae bacterium]